MEAISRLGYKIKKIFVYTIICIIVFITIFPIAWTLLGSFKTLRDLVTPVPKIVFKPVLSNYQTVFAREDIREGLLNSVIISGSAIILGILFGVPAAYAIARNTKKLKPHLQFFALSLRFLPPVAIAIPFITLWLDIGLYDSHIALITTYLIISISTIIWLSISPFESVPIECEEVAKLDGCSYIQTFFKISLPLAMPNLMGGFVFTFILLWNELLLALSLTSTNVTLPVAVAAITAIGKELPWGTVNAAAIVLLIPPLLLIRFFGKSASSAFFRS